MIKGIVITGTLYDKNGKALAVGEWEALQHFIDTTKKLNPKHFNKRDFVVKTEYSTKAIEEAEVVMAIGFDGVFKMYSKEKGESNGI